MTVAPMQIPPGVVASGALPAVCVAHGEPTAGARAVRFRSRAPVWVALVCVLSLPVGLVVALVLRKTVRSSAWPVCAGCVRWRAGRGRAAAFTGLGTVVCLGLTFVVGGGGGPVGTAGAVGTVVLLAVSLLLLSQRSWSRAARGSVDRTTGWVVFRDPSPEFVAAVSGGRPRPAADAS